jgi:hypothetical protein
MPTKKSCSCRSSHKKLCLLRIKKSPKAEKKLRASFCKQGKIKNVDFGAKGYSDFTIHKDIERRNRYKKRHSARENFNSPLTRGALSYHILWGKSTSLKKNIRSFKKKFHL